LDFSPDFLPFDLTESSISESGGCIQWEEIRIGKISQTHKEDHPRFTKIIHTAFDHGAGFSWSSPKVIYRHAQELGMVNIKKYDYNSLSAPVANEMVQQWSTIGLSKLLPIALVGAKKESDPAMAQVKGAQMMDELKKLYAKGVNGDWTFGTVVAQKSVVQLDV
jgi:hypothetical protein